MKEDVEKGGIDEGGTREGRHSRMGENVDKEGTVGWRRKWIRKVQQNGGGSGEQKQSKMEEDRREGRDRRMIRKSIFIKTKQGSTDSIPFNILTKSSNFLIMIHKEAGRERR